jgi:hypothetical protein
MASLGGNECQTGEEEELGARPARLSLETSADRGAPRCLEIPAEKFL